MRLRHVGRQHGLIGRALPIAAALAFSVSSSACANSCGGEEKTEKTEEQPAAVTADGSAHPPSRFAKPLRPGAVPTVMPAATPSQKP